MAERLCPRQRHSTLHQQCNTEDSAAVGFFRLFWASPTELALQQRCSPVSLGNDWNVHMNQWQDYLRVVASRHTENALVVSVEVQTSDELRVRHRHSFRYVCAIKRQLYLSCVHAAGCRGGTLGSQCPWKATNICICAGHTLTRASVCH